MLRPLAIAALLTLSGTFSAAQDAAPGKPNILMIMGDDIGWSKVSAYSLGIMGYQTPNIDSLARDGALFTDWYG
jgi:arylsulfatase